MNPIAGATVTAPDLDAAVAAYARHFGYRTVETGSVADSLAESWGCPASAGVAYALMQPESGAPCHVRFVKGAARTPSLPLRTYGWAALEIVVRDVDALAARLAGAPFEVIGPPADVTFSKRIRPMQVVGPSGEPVFLTMVKPEDPAAPETAPYDLHVAACEVDRIFILVFASSDIERTLALYRDAFGWTTGPVVGIDYKVLDRAFGTAGRKVPISTVQLGREVFLEIDQYPAEATARPREGGALAPGVSVATFFSPSLDRVNAPFLAPPRVQPGAFYAGRRSATIAGPDGELIELIEGAP